MAALTITCSKRPSSRCSLRIRYGPSSTKRCKFTAVKLLHQRAVRALDARRAHNLIGEGANEVLKAFIASSAFAAWAKRWRRPFGIKNPLASSARFGDSARAKVSADCNTPEIPVNRINDSRRPNWRTACAISAWQSENLGSLPQARPRAIERQRRELAILEVVLKAVHARAAGRRRLRPLCVELHFSRLDRPPHGRQRRHGARARDPKRPLFPSPCRPPHPKEPRDLWDNIDADHHRKRDAFEGS